MHDDSRYTDHRRIMASLSSILKGKTLDESDVLEWCMECERNYIKDPEWMFYYTRIPLEVTGANTETVYATLPCNVIRLLDVYQSETATTPVRVNNTGVRIFLPQNYPSDAVYVNFTGGPVDLDTGMPLILIGHEEACKAYVVKQMYYEDFLNNAIDYNRWAYIVQDFQNKCTASRNSTWIMNRTRDQMEDLPRISMNMIRMIGDQQLYHTQWSK